MWALFLSLKAIHVLSCYPQQNTQHTLTLMLLRLTSTRSGSFLFILNSVSSTSVELGSSSGTGLYWVHWITPTTRLQNTVSRTAGHIYICLRPFAQLSLYIKSLQIHFYIFWSLSSDHKNRTKHHHVMYISHIKD